jgi:hypothetical protein
LRPMAASRSLLKASQYRQTSVRLLANVMSPGMCLYTVLEETRKRFATDSTEPRMATPRMCRPSGAGFVMSSHARLITSGVTLLALPAEQDLEPFCSRRKPSPTRSRHTRSVMGTPMKELAFSRETPLKRRQSVVKVPRSAPDATVRMLHCNKARSISGICDPISLRTKTCY